MRIKLAVPEEHLSDDERKFAIDAALEATTRATMPLIRRGIVPTAAAAIRNGLRWKPEPPGDEHFDLPMTTIPRKWGDCDDLAPHHAASLRATGEDPGAVAEVIKSGPNRWHAIVNRSDGSRDDPSKWAGMGNGVSGINGIGAGGSIIGAPPAMWGPLHHDRMAMACYPMTFNGRRYVCSRVDVPDQALQMHYSAVHTAPTVHGSIIGALELARVVADTAQTTDADADMLATLHGLLCGHSPEEICGAMREAGVSNPEQIVDEAITVGAFFGSVGSLLDIVTKPVAHLLKPLTSAYDKVSPYTTMLFPGSAALRYIDPARTLLETGDPMAAYKSVLIPGARSGKDFFQRNPLGHLAYGAAGPLLQNIPGASTWLAAARPGAPGPGAPATLPGGDGTATMQLDPMTMLQSFFPDGGGPQFAAMAPGVPTQSPAGPTFLRF